MRTHARHLIQTLALACAVVACATPRAEHIWYEELAAADRDFDHGRYAEARAAYERLRPDADAEMDRYIRYQLAVVRARDGDPEGGLRDLRALQESIAASHADELPEEWGSRASFERARIHEALLGDPQRARELYVQTIVDYPDSAAAKHAFEIVLDIFAERDRPWDTVMWLASVYPRVEATAIGDNVAYEMARVFQREGELRTADELYARTALTYPGSGLTDNIGYNRAEIALDEGRVDDALFLYDLIAREHDTSWSFGEYDSNLRDDAMLARAQIFEDTGRPERAIEEIDRLLEAFPTYFGGGKMAWRRAEIVRTRLGDAARYRAALRRLVSDFPESVYAEKAVFRLGLLDQGVPLTELPDHRMPRN